MTSTFDISTASRTALALEHMRLLHDAPSIRVHNRWGPFSEYSVKAKLRDIETLLSAARPEATDPWRVVFGWDHGLTVDVQYYDADLHEWDSALHEVSDGATVADTVSAWLDERCPAWRALVEIDRKLLR